MGRTIFIILILISAVSAAAEEYSTMTESSIMGRNFGLPSAGGQGELTVLMETAFFFKNLELFNLDHALGETFTGYRIPIRAGYKPRKDLALELGVMLGHDFGDQDRLNATAPVVRLMYEPTSKLYVIAGTLLPTHWICDAFLDDSQKFRNDVEQGFQLRANKNWLKNDTWINWRVREGEVSAEEYEIGMSHQFRMLGNVLHLDGQFMWTHAGGQVSSRGRIEQNLLYLSGASVGTGEPLGFSACQDIRLSYRWMYSREENDHTDLAKGYGRSFSAHSDFRIQPYFVIRAFAEVFNGDGFVATLGDPLFQLDEYNQIGCNLLFNVADNRLHIEAGFVKQYTADDVNLTYQLSMVWNDGFSLGRIKSIH
ncbi:MAG: hypothetical protein GY780_11170 [bacterium]|nr:hypothetical protein [bacterium]